MFDENQNLAVKARSTFHRKAGVKVLSDLNPDKMPWSDLTKVERAAQEEARRLLDTQLTEESDAAERGRIESVINTLADIITLMSHEKDDRTAAGTRDPIEDPRRPHLQGRANGAGHDGEAETAARILDHTAEPRDKFQTYAQARHADEYRGLTLGRYFRAMTTGAKSEVERRALSEGSDSAGGYTVPEYLGGALIDALRAQSVCVRAGAITMPLTTSVNNVAKLLTDPTPGWRDELGNVAESDPTFGNVALNPQSLAVKCSVSHELLSDSLNLETELPRIMAAAMATELDRVALLGTGTAPEPRGVANTSGIGTTALDGALTGYTQLVKARTGILSGNAGPVTAFVMHPRDEGTLVGMSDGEGQPLNAPRAIEVVPMLTTTAIPTDGGTGDNESTIIAGNFRNLILGIRQDIRIEVLRHTLGTNLTYTFVAHMRADVAVQHAAAFHTITGVQA